MGAATVEDAVAPVESLIREGGIKTETSKHAFSPLGICSVQVQKNKTSKNNYQIPTIVKNRKKIIVSFFDTMIILCTYYTKSCLFITIHFLVYYCSIPSRFFLLKYETTHNKKQKLQKKPCIIAKK